MQHRRVLQRCNWWLGWSKIVSPNCSRDFFSITSFQQLHFCWAHNPERLWTWNSWIPKKGLVNTTAEIPWLVICVLRAHSLHVGTNPPKLGVVVASAWAKFEAGIEVYGGRWSMGRTASSPFSLFSACMLVVCLRLRHLRECWWSRRTFWNSTNLWSWKHFNVPSWGYDFLAACTAYREQQLCF